MSMIDPKGSRPKVLGKSKAFDLTEQHRMFAEEFETKVWPALALPLIESHGPTDLVTNDSMGFDEAPVNRPRDTW